jgi:hypothetical protein
MQPCALYCETLPEADTSLCAMQAPEPKQECLPSQQQLLPPYWHYVWLWRLRKCRTTAASVELRRSKFTTHAVRSDSSLTTVGSDARSGVPMLSSSMQVCELAGTQAQTRDCMRICMHTRVCMKSMPTARQQGGTHSAAEALIWIALRV